MILKLHAWIYRTFGIYSKYAERKCIKYIRELNKEEKMTDFEISLAIGLWQAKHGFYMSYEELKKRIKNKGEKND